MLEFSKSHVWVYYAYILYGEVTIFKVILGVTKKNVAAKSENILEQKYFCSG